MILRSRTTHLIAATLLLVFTTLGSLAGPVTNGASGGANKDNPPTYGGGYAADDKAAIAQEPDSASTSDIVSATTGAFTKCFKWSLRGICVWLVCTYYECHLDETLRVQHFTPDVVFSVWHEPKTHPWRDYGRKLAEKLDGAGKWLTNNVPIGGASSSFSLVDSAGTKSTVRTHGDSRNINYRGVDAIGNPTNYIQGAITGNFGLSGDSPTSVPIPMPMELMQWFSEFPGNVTSHWTNIPAAYTSDRTTYARHQSDGAASLLELVGGNAGSTASKILGTYNKATSLFSVGGSVQLGGAGGGTGVAGGAGGGGSGGNVSGNVGAATGGSQILCPPAIMGFGLAFQSDLDSWFWRGILPLESLYPEPWLPGMREVGSGAFQTWGSVWPRQGTLYQAHPVKAAAVTAQRAGDIISHKAQPHIYSPLQLDTDKNYKFFGFQGIREHDKKHTLWQRVFPKAQKSCEMFGTDDSLSLPNGFGDGHNLVNRSTMWLAWRRQDCCIKPSSGLAVFLFSIPPGEDR